MQPEDDELKAPFASTNNTAITAGTNLKAETVATELKYDTGNKKWKTEQLESGPEDPLSVTVLGNKNENVFKKQPTNEHDKLTNIFDRSNEG